MVFLWCSAIGNLAVAPWRPKGAGGSTSAAPSYRAVNIRELNLKSNSRILNDERVSHGAGGDGFGSEGGSTT